MIVFDKTRFTFTVPLSDYELQLKTVPEGYNFNLNTLN